VKREGLEELRLSWDGVGRRALVQTPDVLREGLPLVLVLHGQGASAEYTLVETRFGDLARHAGFLAVFPEALPVDPVKLPAFLQNPLRWNTGSMSGRFAGPKTDDTGFLAALLDELAERFPFDPQRVFCTGFSNGAAMTFRLAAELSERLAAVAPVSALCPVAAPRLARPMPTLFIIGAEDPVLPLDGGPVRTPWREQVVRPPVRDTLTRWATALGCDPSPRLLQDDDTMYRERYDAEAAGAALEVVFVKELGHHWPGGKGQWQPEWAGKWSDRVSATEMIWEFFAAV
jgi:polyhydroxybutyrate depolymerase